MFSVVTVELCHYLLGGHDLDATLEDRGELHTNARVGGQPAVEDGGLG